MGSSAETGSPKTATPVKRSPGGAWEQGQKKLTGWTRGESALGRGRGPGKVKGTCGCMCGRCGETGSGGGATGSVLPVSGGSTDLTLDVSQVSWWECCPVSPEGPEGDSGDSRACQACQSQGRESRMQPWAWAPQTPQPCPQALGGRGTHHIGNSGQVRPTCCVGEMQHN